MQEVEVKIFGTYPRCMFNAARLRTIGSLVVRDKWGDGFTNFFQYCRYTAAQRSRTPLTYEQCTTVRCRDYQRAHQKYGGRDPGSREVFPPGQLIADNTSIKTQPVAAMLDCRPSRCRGVGDAHRFGPAVDSLRQQNVSSPELQLWGAGARV